MHAARCAVVPYVVCCSGVLADRCDLDASHHWATWRVECAERMLRRGTSLQKVCTGELFGGHQIGGTVR